MLVIAARSNMDVCFIGSEFSPKVVKKRESFYYICKLRSDDSFMVKKVFYSLGSLAAILLLSGVLSILEYRRMSDYVSELIAANIKSINLAQKLSDITEEYNHQMLAVVVQNDISLMPEFDLADFMAQSDSLKNSFTSIKALPMVDSVEVSFDAFMKEI
jgi:hypothetical protein